MSIRGCLPVVATPFDEHGSVDVEGLRRVVDLNVQAGCDGLTCFGLASELYKLDDSDRLIILNTLISATPSNIPVIVGCEHSGNLVAARRCRQAAEQGASAIMLLPPSFTPPSRQALMDYYLGCAEAADLPVIIQDAPAWTGVQMAVDLLRELRQQDARIASVKLEAPPIASKARELRSAGFSIISGYGAVHLREDVYLNIIDGFMPGCSIPEAMVLMWRLVRDGRLDEFVAMFDSLLPLLIAELTDLDTFIEVQKLILVARGVITSVYCRQPHQSIDAVRKEYIQSEISKALRTTRGLGIYDDF